jgi:magnesium chelatase family protein
LDYQAKLSGPLVDRIDLHIDVPPVSARDLALPPAAEGSREVAIRVAAARARQVARFETAGAPHIRVNAHADGDLLERTAHLSEEARAFLMEAADRVRLTARGYHRIIRVARTLADLDEAETISRLHTAEALSYRNQNGAALGVAA